MKKYGFFARVKDSFANPLNIARLIFSPSSSKSGSYLVLFSLLMAVVLSISLFSALFINDGLSGITEFVEEIPNFSYHNSNLTTDLKSGETFIRENSEAKVLVTLSHAPLSIPSRYNNYSIIEINDKGITITSSDRYQTFKPQNLSKSDVLRTINVIGIFVVIFSLLLSFIFYIVNTLFIALLTAIAGLIINAVMGLHLQFKAIFSLSIYAMTARFLLQIFSSVLNIFVQLPVSLNWYISVLISSAMLVYFFAVIRGNPDKLSVIPSPAYPYSPSNYQNQSQSYYQPPQPYGQPPASNSTYIQAPPYSQPPQGTYSQTQPPYGQAHSSYATPSTGTYGQTQPPYSPPQGINTQAHTPYAPSPASGSDYSQPQPPYSPPQGTNTQTSKSYAPPTLDAYGQTPSPYSQPQGTNSPVYASCTPQDSDTHIQSHPQEVQTDTVESEMSTIPNPIQFEPEKDK